MAVVYRYCSVACIGIAMLYGDLATNISHAQPLSSGSKSNLMKKSTLKNMLAPGIFYEGYFESTLETMNNFNLDDRDDEDTLTLENELGLSLLVDPGKWFRLFLQTELTREDLLENNSGDDEKGWQWRIRQAFFDLPNITSQASLRIGRQNFKDDMEWFYDAELDGIRLLSTYNDISVEASVSREHFFNIDQFDSRKDDEIDNYILVAKYAPKKKSQTSGYIIFRDEETFDGNNPEDLLYFGIQSTGQVSSSFEYWLNAAYLTGERTTASAKHEIDAYAFDVGGTFIFEDMPYEPSLTFGYAYGSGDDNRNRSGDTNFRQTGLQDNNYKFNGVTNFKYLGELFDPEISNINILTLGVGIRPTDNSSIDIVYHNYQQNKAVDRLSGTSIDLDPMGFNKDLGQELDIIIGYKEIENVYVEGVFGVFFPGKAFKNDADTAYLGKIQIGVEF